MKWIRNISIFLSSIHFAIALIAATALFVIAGTLLESKTESHRYAASLTYSHPLFIFLLWGFFINILFSALRRWPFKKKHIPFLITHLGLLMLLGGVIIKSYFGVQGSMSIIEGGASNAIMLSDTYVVEVEDRGHKKGFYRLNQRDSPLFPDLHLEMKGYHPHSSETMETWFKQGKLALSRLPPLPVGDGSPTGKARLSPFSTKMWDIIVLQSASIREAAQKAYIDGTTLLLSQTNSQETLYEGPLAEALDKLIPTQAGSVRINLGLDEPLLTATIGKEKIMVPLDGPEALLNKNATTPYLGSAPITVDLKRNPTLVFIEDPQQEIALFAFDEYGRVHSETFKQGNLHSVVVYDEGFGGYAVQAFIPFPEKSLSRSEMEAEALNGLKTELKESLTLQPELSPPLQLLQKACEAKQVDFASVCLDFLQAWDKQHGWLLPDHFPLPVQFDWSEVPENHRKASAWIAKIMPPIEQELKEGNELLDILEKRQWPLVQAMKERRLPTGASLTLLAQQIFSIVDMLPDPPERTSDAKLLSAYLRAFDIHLAQIKNPLESHEQGFLIETPIAVHHRAISALKKLEDNLPLLLLEVNGKEKIALTYDKYGAGLKWPILSGQYLIRFQPEVKPIPYRIRLRDARQINYPGTAQPYSYECDLIIKDLRNGTSVERSLSMNHVHETWDGYRFYMASLSPSTETAAQHIQIVVNRDPGKYWLTYPGAIFLSLGILLLFWMRPYKIR